MSIGKKIEDLDELVEASNSPVLIFYNYKHEESRIMKSLKAYKPRKLETAEDIKLWNKGKIQVLVAHLTIGD